MDENLWLKSMSKKLSYAEFSRVNEEIIRQGKAARLGAYIYVIAGVNDAAMKEEIKMKKWKNRFYEVMEETGLAAEFEAKGEARGEERKSFSIAQNLVKLGVPIETIISATQLAPEKVKTLYQQVEAN